MSFDEAEKFCFSLGGHLASIQSEEENKEVLQLADQQREKAWIESKSSSYLHRVCFATSSLSISEYSSIVAGKNIYEKSLKRKN